MFSRGFIKRLVGILTGSLFVPPSRASAVLDGGIKEQDPWWESP